MEVGRKTFDGKDEQDVIAKCSEIWALDGTDAEASSFANISSSSLCRYLQNNPEVKELRDRLKQNPFLKARRTIVESLDQPNYAFEYMKRKKKDEFSDRIEHTGEDGKAITIQLAPEIAERYDTDTSPKDNSKG